ncbi:MAG: glycosyltransferase family 9 protein, partial [Campylobacter sp.]
GDVLLTTPLIENLHHFYPDATIDFALNKECSAMIQGNPNVRKIHEYDRSARQNGFFKRLIAEIKLIHAIKKEKYDIAIQTTTGDRGVIIAKYAKIKQIIGFEGKNEVINRFLTHKVPRFVGLKHTVDLNLDALRALGHEPVSKKVSVYFDEKCLDGIDLPTKFIHFHITSRWMFKCAKNETIAQIIDYCQNELGIKAVITGDNNNAELERINKVISLCKSDPINLAAKLSLKQVVAVSKRSLMYIGVDTAIMHIAAANDVPVIAFFGPSGAFDWGPWDNSLMQSGYTKQNGIQTMGKHIVFQKDWECVPCDKNDMARLGIEDMLMDFSKEMPLIKEKIKSNLEKK